MKNQKEPLSVTSLIFYVADFVSAINKMCQLICVKFFWIWLPWAKWLRTTVVEVRKTLSTTTSYFLVWMVKLGLQ